MYKKILVPVDLSKPKMAKKMCLVAKEIASLADAEITLMNVLPGYSMPMVASYFPEHAQDALRQETHDALAQMAKEHLSGQVHLLVETGKRGQVIIEEAKQHAYDLVLIGTRRKMSRGAERLLGSCSSSVADRAGCSVLVVR